MPIDKQQQQQLIELIKQQTISIETFNRMKESRDLFLAKFHEAVKKAKDIESCHRILTDKI